jgi:putative glycosyltransferase (TIGR04372 family)
VPSALTNWMPLTSNPMQGRDRFIPKLLYSRSENRHLTFGEMLSQPRDIWTGKYFEREQLEAVDNTTEQIAEVVREMLDAGRGERNLPTEEDQALQQRYRALLEQNEVYGLAPMGTAFLRAHRHLLS